MLRGRVATVLLLWVGLALLSSSAQAQEAAPAALANSAFTYRGQLSGQSGPINSGGSARLGTYRADLTARNGVWETD